MYLGKYTLVVFEYMLKCTCIGSLLLYGHMVRTCSTVHYCTVVSAPQPGTAAAALRCDCGAEVQRREARTNAIASALTMPPPLPSKTQRKKAGAGDPPPLPKQGATSNVGKSSTRAKIPNKDQRPAARSTKKAKASKKRGGVPPLPGKVRTWQID